MKYMNTLSYVFIIEKEVHVVLKVIILRFKALATKVVVFVFGSVWVI